MKVYVDELPKDDCPCNRDGRCRLLQKECYVCYFEMEKNEHCPLNSIADYTKQVRKEVCEEIRTKLKPKEIFHPEDDFEVDYDFYYKEDVEEILDQIQGDKIE